MRKNIPVWIGYAGLFFVLLLHFPFLNADPDMDLSLSRDAFTDEGLNTSQIRNYINHGDLDYMECDNLVKTPLFAAVLIIPFEIFGTYLAVARVTILILVFLLLLIGFHTFSNSIFTLVFSATTLLQYYVFQYSHFSLSEMFSVALIFCGLGFLYRFIKRGFHEYSYLFLSVLFVSLSWYGKIQFAYMFPLVPTTVALLGLTERNKNAKVAHLKSFLFALGGSILFVLIYYFAWYQPHKAAFDFVMENEAADKYATFNLLPRIIASNMIHLLFNEKNWVFNTLGLICFIAGCRIFFHAGRSFRLLFLISSAWVFLELHKLTMIYLPSRYLVSYYFSIGFLSAVIITELIREGGLNKKVFILISSRRLAQFLLCLFGVVNLMSYFFLFSDRQYELKSINQYFSRTLSSSNTVLGAWGPSLTWNSKSISKPVWHDFMNDKNIFEDKPTVILSEPDEDESNHAYSLQGINLKIESDSVHSFAIGRWNVNAYWIHSK